MILERGILDLVAWNGQPPVTVKLSISYYVTASFASSTFAANNNVVPGQ